MSSPEPSLRPVLVAGDVCLDVVAVPIAEKAGSASDENWRQTGETRTFFLPGGSMLLTQMIRDACEATVVGAVKPDPLKPVSPDEQATRARVNAAVTGPKAVLPQDLVRGTESQVDCEELEKWAERLTREEIVHSLIELDAFPTTSKSDDKAKTLRVLKTHGFSGPGEPGKSPELRFCYPGGEHTTDILVLDDTGNSFRKAETAATKNPWPHPLRTKSDKQAKPPLIVYKLHRPLPKPTDADDTGGNRSPQPPGGSQQAVRKPADSGNALWDTVAKDHSLNRLVVVSVEDLREMGAPISRGLSWERTATDVTWQLLNHPGLKPLMNCPRLIIRLGESGAIYWKGPDASKPPFAPGSELPVAWLVYDPQQIEGSVQAKFDQRGWMVGNGSAFVAGLVSELAAADEESLKALLQSPAAAVEPVILKGIRRGLLASNRLVQSGFGAPKGPPRYPARTLYGVPVEADPSFACRAIRMIPSALEPDRSYWRLLDDILSDERDLQSAVEQTALGSKPNPVLASDADPEELEKAKVALRAKALLDEVPVAIYGKSLRTHDRLEIENYRAIYGLFHNYIRQREPERPLSIAVFGPPGSGKSFGVKQVAESLNEGRTGRAIVELTFNLSQYHSADELAPAFHRVRDCVLEGKIPLVFFDEFDASLANEPLGWLRYFLAPMQDGKFLDEGGLHPIGQAIFIFAGGTSDTYSDFAHRQSKDEQDNFKKAKGPDFLSRLRGALNIPSLNFLQPAGPATEKAPRKPGTFDAYGPIESLPCSAAVLLRRAGVLAYQAGRKAPTLKGPNGRLRIRPEVVRAFLYLPEFEHGNRSLEALLDMSQLVDARNFTASLLPSGSNASLHANPEFLTQLITTDFPFSPEERETIAESVHQTYLETKTANRDPRALLPWNDPQFPDDFRKSNREQVDHIPQKLRSVGLWFRKAPLGVDPDIKTGELLIQRHLLELAEFEHDRWSAQKRRQGWAAGAGTDSANKISDRKLHNCLFPWDRLDETQKQQDHSTILALPRNLAKARYEVMRLHRFPSGEAKPSDPARTDPAK